MNREKMNFDVIIVGAGPAGLSAAIRLQQLSVKNNTPLSIALLEKASEVGGHILSGAVFESDVLSELIPDWSLKGAPLNTPVSEEHFYFLTKKYHIPLPLSGKKHNNFVISLGELCRWLGEQATELGINIFPGFAGYDLLFDEQKKVIGIVTVDSGLNKKGQKTKQFQAGVEIYAQHVFLAEGCRGSLSKKVIKQFDLDKNKQPQTYALGIKELWKIKPTRAYKPGKIIHTVGWPLDYQTYGGGFIYHLADQQVALGVIVGLDYQNPYLDPFEELQRFKTHPKLKALFKNGERLAYGARTLSEGGYQSIPTLTIPGLTLIGDSAGFLNVPKLKGTHTAIKSGMIAAEVFYQALLEDNLKQPLPYQEALEKTWLWQELYVARNIRPAFKNLFLGLSYAAIDQFILRGNAPWTFKHHRDHLQLKLAKLCKKNHYPKPDNELTFDKLSSVHLSNAYHREDQPCHLQLKNMATSIERNWRDYDSPETRYCPASVYEIITSSKAIPRLQINAQNCIHCKACDIKDPEQNITWVPPENGGPYYEQM